jgi:hypothetical protein
MSTTPNTTQGHVGFAFGVDASPVGAASVGAASIGAASLAAGTIASRSRAPLRRVRAVITDEAIVVTKQQLQQQQQPLLFGEATEGRTVGASN